MRRRRGCAERGGPRARRGIGDTLFLMGDDASGSRKDGAAQAIAAKYCVLAMGGDQLGDFSDLFNSEPKSVAARARRPR
jgi:hypothetical protein